MRKLKTFRDLKIGDRLFWRDADEDEVNTDKLMKGYSIVKSIDKKINRLEETFFWVLDHEGEEIIKKDNGTNFTFKEEKDENGSNFWKLNKRDIIKMKMKLSLFNI